MTIILEHVTPLNLQINMVAVQITFAMQLLNCIVTKYS